MFLEILLGKRFLETLKTVPEIRARKTYSWEPCLGTCSWKPLPGNPCLDTSSWKPLPGNTCLKTSSEDLVLLGKHMFLEILLGKRFLETLKTVPEIRARKTYSWEPCLEPLGNLSWEPLPENLPLRNLFLGTLLGNLLLGTLLGNLFLVTLPGNLACMGTLLGTSSWEPCLGISSWEPAWEPLPENLAWGDLLGTLLGTLLGKLFLGTWEPLLGILLEKATPSWEAGPLLWLKTPRLRCWGKTCSRKSCLGNFLGTLLGHANPFLETLA